jgi:hypothetical protein
MSKKILTVQCPSCKFCIITDDNQFQCTWGNFKKPKILVVAKGKSKTCTLAR